MSQTNAKNKDTTGLARICTRWTPAEDRALVSSMQDLLDKGGWKADNGQFKNGAYAMLEALMEQKLPGCGKKAKPHIESRVKLLRKHFDAITEMLSPQASGFGWNDDGKFVTCPQSVWDAWVKSHKNATGLRNKPFPLFDELGKIFGKDRTNGSEGGSIEEALEEIKNNEGRGEQEDEEDQVPVYNSEGMFSTTGSGPSEPPVDTPSRIKTKRARTKTIDALRDFATTLDKMSDVMVVTGEHIGRLASFFQHESDSAGRRMNVASEIMKIKELTPAEVIMASKTIALNPLEVDFFFSLPEDYRYAYV